MNLFLVAIVLLGCVFGFTGCFPITPVPSNRIHVFVFSGFRRVEIERNIADEITTDDSLFHNAIVLRHEITNRLDIIELVELGYIGTIFQKVPEIAYAYHILVDAPPTDGVLDALAKWAEETTERSGSTVSVFAIPDTFWFILQMSSPPPAVMSVEELRSRD